MTPTERPRPSKEKRLSPHGHAVYKLTPKLLLVFKPSGHAEPEHAHTVPQTLRILAGELEVQLERNTFVLTPGSAPLTIAPGVLHATKALVDTWLVVERS